MRMKMPLKPIKRGKNNIPKITVHSGTCDYCNQRYKVVFDFGYDEAPQNYRVCVECFEELFCEHPNNLHNYALYFNQNLKDLKEKHKQDNTKVK